MQVKGKSVSWAACRRVCLLVLLASLLSVGVTADGGAQSNLTQLHVMVDQFLNLVQPDSKHLLDLLPILGVNTTNLAAIQLGNILTNLQTRWKDVLSYFAGYIAAVLFGLVYIIVALFSCCCYCCCRKCGRCGGSLSKKPVGKSDGCTRIILGCILLSITAIMVAGIAFSFLNGEALAHQLSVQPVTASTTVASNPGLLGAMQIILNSIVSYLHSVAQDIMAFGNSMNSISSIVMNPVYGVIVNALRVNVVVMNNTMNATADLLNCLLQISASLGTIQQAGQQLQSLQTQVKSSLASVNSTVLTAVAAVPCTPTDASCNNIKADMTAMMLNPDFNLITNTSLQFTAVQNSLVAGGTVQTLATNEIVKNNFGSINAIQLPTNVTKAFTDVIQSFSNVISSLQGNVFNSTSSVLGPVEDYMKKAFIGIGCALLLVAVFNILGFLSALVCPPPTIEKGGTCSTRKLGATMLNGSICSSFVFGCILMFVVVITFLIGGLVKTEICRDLMKEENSTLLRELSNMFHDLLASIAANITFSTDISDAVFVKCKNNSGIVQAFGLQNFVNSQLSSALSSLTANNPFNGALINLAMINISTPAVLADLNYIKIALANITDFTAFYTQLNQTLTNKDLNSVASDLNSFTQGDVTVYKAQAVILQNLASGPVTQMQTAMLAMRSALNTLSLYINGGTQTFGARIDTLISLLTTAQANITQLPPAASTNLNASLFDALKTGVSSTTSIVQTQISTLGPCRPMYVILDGLFTALCRNFLDPFNTMWFTYGWCIAMFIPSVILGAILSGMYKRMPPDGEQDRAQGMPYSNRFPNNRMWKRGQNPYEPSPRSFKPYYPTKPFEPRRPYYPTKPYDPRRPYYPTSPYEPRRPHYPTNPYEPRGGLPSYFNRAPGRGPRWAETPPPPPPLRPYTVYNRGPFIGSATPYGQFGYRPMYSPPSYSPIGRIY